MLCDQCQQAEATVQQIKITDNQITHTHLCETCADDDSAQEPETGESVSSIVSSMFDVPDKDKVSCERCGMTFDEFQTVGRVGCARCYDTFRSRIESLVHRIHGSDQHLGKESETGGLARVSDDRKLQILEKQLERAVNEEQYEKAAELRDEIQELKEGTHESAR
ncbi:MAG: UvrB/UvrC motif-containing protein [bacterium]